MNLNTISLPWVSKANKTQIGSPKETLRLKLWQSKCAWEQQNPNRISKGNFETEAWQSKCAWEQQNPNRVFKGNFETEAWQSKCAWEYLHQCPCNWGGRQGVAQSLIASPKGQQPTALLEPPTSGRLRVSWSEPERERDTHTHTQSSEAFVFLWCSKKEFWKTMVRMLSSVTNVIAETAV